VSAAWRAATTGKDQSFRARRRRAAAVLGWHGVVTGPVLALVAVLAQAWRRRKTRTARTARTASPDAGAQSAAESAKTAKTAEAAEDVEDAESAEDVVHEDGASAVTARCGQCGASHTFTLAPGEPGREVACPCGARLFVLRKPSAESAESADFDRRRRPRDADSPTYTRRSRPMSANPLAAAAAELNAVAAGHAPADMWQVARELDQLAEVPANVGMALRTYTVRLQGEYPIHPAVVEALGQLYAAHAQLVSAAEAIGPLFRSAHAEDLKREEAPRINEQAWNV
jgi:hypothetical protein